MIRLRLGGYFGDEMVKQSGRKVSACKVAFLAMIPTLTEARKAGWALTVIYEEHKEKLCGISYSQFTRYVKRFIDNDSENTVARKGKVNREESTMETQDRKGQGLPRFDEAVSVKKDTNELY